MTPEPGAEPLTPEPGAEPLPGQDDLSAAVRKAAPDLYAKDGSLIALGPESLRTRITDAGQRF